MNSKVRIQTNKAKLDECLRQSLIFWLNLHVSLTDLSWSLFIGGQVSRNRSGSIQTCRLWRLTYQIPYSNTIHFDFYLGPIFYGSLPEYTSGVPTSWASVVIPLSLPIALFITFKKAPEETSSSQTYG
jgi:hypothetical protein